MTNEDLIEKLLAFYQREIERLTQELANKDRELQQLHETIIRLTEKLENKSIVINPAPPSPVIPMTPSQPQPWPPVAPYCYVGGSVATTIAKSVES